MSGSRLVGEGLVRVFHGEEGVHGIDLDVRAAEVHALVGLNGAGKTTLLRLLLGMLRPDAGNVQVDGHDLERLDTARWAKVGHLVGPPLAYPELTVRANLTMAARLHSVTAARIGQMVSRALSEFDLDRYADVRARALSEGNRRRVGLAGALQHDPDLIVLDEPTSTLDPAGVILLRERLLRDTDRGAGVVVSSHHLDEVARIATRISVVNQGRVIGALDPRGIDIERSFFALVHRNDMERP